MSNEKEFLRLTSLCISRLSNSNPDFSIIGSDLTQAETLLRQLKIESAYLPNYQRQEVMQRCVKYLSDVNNIKKQLRDREQEKLFGNKLEVQIENSKNLLERQGSTLELGKKMSLESEKIAGFTMENLRNQRNQLNKSTFGVKEIRENLGKSNKLINSLQRKATTNKLIMICIIILLFFSIIMISILRLID